MKSLVLSILAGMGALALMCPQTRADEWNKKTVFTFSGPVEVPGNVLPAGSYVFKLADSQSNRHIVQVFNDRENHLYGTFLTIPEYRAKAPDKPTVVFEERASDSPQAIKAWFYPGDNYGDEFIYPKRRVVETASVTRPLVPSASPDLPEQSTEPAEISDHSQVTTMEQSPAVAPQTDGEEELAQATPSAPAEPQSALSAPETTPSETAPSEKTPEQLPKTASTLPLIGLIGFVSLGAGWSLRVAARRIG